MWDLFISHASEDKENLVRPLAEELVKYGVNVWYDDFDLELGDSLTASIDKGLIDSKFGLLIISPSFFQKSWTEYELKSLLTKEINGGKVILPVWHNVTADFVASKSLFLADKKAISSGVGFSKLAFEIVKVVRPDIINSFLLKKACREMKSGKSEKTKIKDLHLIESVKHKELPLHLVIASKLLHTFFPVGSFEDFVKDFARDADYDEEFVLWVVMSCAYIDTMRKFNINFSEESICRNIFGYLLCFSMNCDEECEKIDLNDEIKTFMIQSYYSHASVLFPIIKK